MRTAWKHVNGMGKMVQVRNVPEDVHRKLKALAAMEGVSLSDYILAEMRRMAELPTLKEMIERLKSLPPVETRTPTAEVLRREREKRTRTLARRR